MKQLVLASLRFYQRFLSPLLLWWSWPFGGCRYYPTCSEYCYQSIVRDGIWKGMLRGLGRLLRCQPWAKGGFDPIQQ